MYGSKRYVATKVGTSRPEDLIVQLYEGVVKKLDQLIQCVLDQDIKGTGESTDRILDILNYLDATLIHEHAPELSAHLQRTYQGWSTTLVRCRVESDVSGLEAIRTQVEELADAWRQAVRMVQDGGQSE